MSGVALAKALHLAFISLFVGGTAAGFLLRRAGRSGDDAARAVAARLIRLVAIALQVPGLLGALASGVALIILTPDLDRRPHHWLEVKIAFVLVAGTLAHLDALRAARAVRTGASDASAAVFRSAFAGVSLLLLAGAIVLVAAKPF